MENNKEIPTGQNAGATEEVARPKRRKGPSAKAIKDNEKAQKCEIMPAFCLWQDYSHVYGFARMQEEHETEAREEAGIMPTPRRASSFSIWRDSSHIFGFGFMQG
jgi:hypothetical protein